MQPGRVLIIGAGLAGSLLAVYLARAGWTVELVERRGDPRAKGFIAGRSINLAISARGIKALTRAGLTERIMKDAIRMGGRMIHPVSGAPNYSPYSVDPTRAINSVSRSALNLGLLEAAANEAGVTIHFDERCSNVDLATRTATFTHERTGVTRDATADLIVGADGAYSAVRGVLQKTERFDYSQSALTHGYKELHIPAVTSGTHAPFAMAPNALHIWPRGKSMMIALPNPDGSFTCTLFWPHDPTDDASVDASGAASGAHRVTDSSFATIRSGIDAVAHFKQVYPDAVALMPTLAEDFQRNPVGTMMTVRCAPWTRRSVTLVGDAAHAVVPFYGQGANASFEDCEALTDALASEPTLESALAAYEAARVDNANAIADMALRNFIEMRDLTARRSYRWKKRIEHTLHALMPRTFVPLYDLVSFSTVPYAEAKARGAANDRLIGWLLVSGALVTMLLIATAAMWISEVTR